MGLAQVLFWTQSVSHWGDIRIEQARWQVTHVDGQNRRIRIGWRYESMTAIAADDRIALNCIYHAQPSVGHSRRAKHLPQSPIRYMRMR